MEGVRCPRHGSCCFLKTGVREGPNKGKSFYICPADACDFVRTTDVPASHCLLHEDSMVELQGLLTLQSEKEQRLFFRCVRSKAEGKQWCGDIPWQDPDFRELSGTSKPQHASKPFRHPPGQQRNPFKVLDENQEPADWKQCLRGEETKKMADKKQREKGAARLLDQKKTQKPEAKSWMKDEVSAGLGVKHKQPAPGEKPQGVAAESLCDAQEPEGSVSKVAATHGRLGEPLSASPQERADGESRDGQKGPAAPKVKATRPLQRGPLSKEHPKSSETAEGQAQDGPGRQTGQQQLLPPGGFQPWTEPRAALAPKGPAAATAQPLGERREADTSSSDSEEDCVASASTEPASPLLFDSSPDSREKLLLPGQNTWGRPFPAAAACKQVAPADPAAQRVHLATQLRQKKSTLASVNVQALPDKGEKLHKQIQELEEALSALALLPEQEGNGKCHTHVPPQSKATTAAAHPLNLVPPAPLQPQGLQPLGSSGLKAAKGAGQHLGGPASQVCLHSLWKVTSEALNALHQSLKSCPDETAVAEDPPGLKVPLLLHQKQALAWLLWRESQKPQGGILADDMGLGKTLTIIALILTQRSQREVKETDESSALTWLSRDDSCEVMSHGTLIVCPASLIHHWKKEVERRVHNNRLSVCLYHGPNRDKGTRALSTYDVVITTYSLVAKEVPTEKQAGKTPEANPGTEGPSTPLLRIVWARIVLDEAHVVRNPRVQTSLAVCRLRARARWAVTGTPIQNNLLDMYSLLKFLRCSPFDDFNLWKSQVDNGSKKGGERLGILTRSLLLRRTKDQLDATGKPLVMLPPRTFRLHRLKLSEAEERVYSVLFAMSRSVLQSYLQRQESGAPGPSGGSPDNPFSRVAQEFRSSGPTRRPMAPRAQKASTMHVLSQLLRLRQCCCHLSLLKSALDPAELKSEGLDLSLEEQLSALNLSELCSPDSSSTITLNGSCFEAELFEDTRTSTKVASLLAELEAVRAKSHKSVVVSQWTGMLRVVARHLRRCGLTYETIDGSVNPKQRTDLVEAFNSSRGPQVMLISLLAGGVGLNLTGGNHLFLLDMHWNPSLEDQACDRIYRLGQKKDVVIHRFVCEGTVEEKILQLQERKKDLAQQVLAASGDSVTKLSWNDLRVLFGL